MCNSPVKKHKFCNKKYPKFMLTVGTAALSHEIFSSVCV